MVVIDNYVNGNACDICRYHQKIVNMPVIFDIEKNRGISFARNKAVASASDNTDFIAFLDDDEIPEPNWLDELLYTSKMFNADIVSGVIVPSFDRPPPKWIEQGGYFTRQRPPTGHLLLEARTGNSLIKRSLFRKIGDFDPRFALTGGEDTHFSMRASRAGFTIVASDESIVYESIHQTQMSAMWILMRAYRIGNTFIRCKTYIDFSASSKVYWALRGFTRIVRGICRIPLSIVFGRIYLVNSFYSIYNGVGILTGLLGYRYNEYTLTHGK